ncbi:MAG: site-specific integrase [Pseudomonadota bacterium]|nr:site-specific integrase [Pseudomonadota bacterium]
MATKRFRNNSWRYTVKNGKVLPRPLYLTFKDESEGDEYVARLENMLERGIVPDNLKENLTRLVYVADVIREYVKFNTISDSDNQLLGVAIERIGDVKLSAITYSWVENYISSMKKPQIYNRNSNNKIARPLAPDTIRHHVGALARCLDWVVRKYPATLPFNPIRLLPKRYASYKPSKSSNDYRMDIERDRRLTLEEEIRIRCILAGNKPENRQRSLELKNKEMLILLFDLALESGMRLREMFTLSMKQIDIIKRTIFLDKTKNGDKRQVPLSTTAIEMLKGHVTMHAQQLLFPWWDGKDLSLRKTTSRLSRQFARIFNAAACQDLHFHDLRHEFTCRLYERTTLSDLQIALITGHKDLRMLKRYANLRGSDLAARMW